MVLSIEAASVGGLFHSCKRPQRRGWAGAAYGGCADGAGVSARRPNAAKANWFLKQSVPIRQEECPVTIVGVLPRAVPPHDRVLACFNPQWPKLNFAVANLIGTKSGLTTYPFDEGHVERNATVSNLRQDWQG
jgi:hypothetical protein